MKIILILLLLNLNLFALANTENSVNIDKSTEHIQNKQKLPIYLEVSDVPESAVTTTIELKNIQETIKSSDAQNKKMHKSIKPNSDSISLLLKSPNYQNITNRNVRELQKMQSELAVYLKQLDEWDSRLKATLEVYDQNRELLKNYSTLWSQTHINAVTQNAPETILNHIASVITDAEALKNSLKTKYDKTLTDSQTVSTNILTIKEIDSALQKQEILIKNQIFYQDKAPLFQLYAQSKFSFSSYLSSINNIIIEKYNEVAAYFQTHADLHSYFIIVTLLAMMFVVYFNYLYRKRKLFIKAESFHKTTFFFIGRPFSTFLILFALIITIIFPDKPYSLIEMLLILLFIPITRILQTIIKKKYYKYIYTIITLYMLFMIGKGDVDYELESRLIMLLINIILFISVLSAYNNKMLYSIKYGFVTKMGNYILSLSSFLLIIAGVANLYGSVLLSSRLINGVFSTIYTSMIFYSFYIILTVYVIIIFRRRVSTASNMLDIYSTKIENSIKFLIKAWMLSWWFLIIVKTLGIYPYIIALKDHLLGLSWNVAQTTISVQSIFDFLFIILGTWILARLTKTLLEVEVFSRFTFPRGIPTAILTTLNYIIVISGTIIAFSSLGVSAQQFALIFGALGVGIGFGLRNIIANFVSGIIMVFERPVQIGDTIEMDKTMGSVLSIGARSSTIKTFDGAEVIIPNADFIAKEITNWTLSDQHRRKVIDFKVDFNSDIDLILQIMKDVALSHPDVLRDPEPLATFQGFDEYYLEFKLYFWLSENLIVAPSDIAITIYKALNKAEVKMPVQKTQLQR